MDLTPYWSSNCSGAMEGGQRRQEGRKRMEQQLELAAGVMKKGATTRSEGLSWRSRLAIFLVLVAALSPAVVEYAFRRQYPVHLRGGVVVTGASTGIGRHAAVTLAEKGYLVFAGVRKEKDSESLQALGIKNLRPVNLDVSVQETIDKTYESVVSALEEEGLPFVGLINNAGVGACSPVEFDSEESVRRIFEVNYFGVIKVTQKFLPFIRKSQGRIINISSVAGLASGPLATTYSATKHALEALSDGLRLELSLFNVSVSVVEPAYVTSEIFGKDPKPDPRALELYGPFFAFEDIKQRQIAKASPPTVTSSAILHALSAQYPKTRYVVANVDGLPATWFARAVWLAPDRVYDAIILSVVRRKALQHRK